MTTQGWDAVPKPTCEQAADQHEADLPATVAMVLPPATEAPDLSSINKL